jgi:hypothetical protein
MIQEGAEPQRWPANRWYGLIALVLAAQFVFIFWLGKPQPVVHRPPADLAPLLQLTGTGAVQVLAFNDPTLFALPHQESFSGSAWLTIPLQEFAPFVWSEPPRFLSLAKDELAADFESFMTTNQPEGLPAVEQPELTLKLPEVEESPSLPDRSRLRLTGALAGRRLLVSPTLPSWPSADILTNSVVQMLVDTDGKPVSATLLSKSGFSEADQHAVREAYRARFEPLNPGDPNNPLAGLTWGQLIFEWHTLPLPATNSPPESSSAK